MALFSKARMKGAAEDASATPPLRLAWKATFIDVEETAACRSRASGRRRARSLDATALRGSSACDKHEEVFGDERRYVASLASRLHSVPGCTASFDFDLEGSEATTPSRMDTPTLSFYSAGADDFEEGGSAAADVTPSASKRASTSEETSGASSSVACNPGSAGHPELCMRPCIYFSTSNGCANGATCEYCHFGHTKRPAHLDKRHRDLLKSLSVAESSGLILPVIRSKLEATDVTVPAAKVLHDLHQLCGLPNDLRVPAPRNRPQRMLVQTLETMSLRSLLTTFGRFIGEPHPHGETLCDELLRHARSSVLP